MRKRYALLLEKGKNGEECWDRKTNQTIMVSDGHASLAWSFPLSLFSR